MDNIRITYYLRIKIGIRQRTTTDGPRGGGSINEAGVFVLRGKQEGGRRGRKTTSTTTTTSTSTTKTTDLSRITTTSISSSENVGQPAALLAPDDQTWFVASTPEPDNFLLSSRGTSRLPPLEIVVKPQAKVVLPCELGGNYSKLLPITRNYRVRPAKWLHNDSSVDMITIDTRTEMSGTGHRYIGDSTTAALHIDNARLEDDGLWKCIIDGDRGEMLTGRPVKLVILEAPRGTYLLIDGRRLDAGNQFVPVKEGSDLSLECAAEGGNPPSTLTWGMTLSQTTLDGPEQPPDNLTIIPSSNNGGNSGAHLKVLRGHHNATIICTARHVTLSIPMNASILLDVQYTPSFAITRIPGFGIPVTEGIPLSLKCEVDSNPTSLPIWQRDNGSPPVEQSEDGWLNFTKISKNDSGWYKCFTRHPLGIFDSIGYFLYVRPNPEFEKEAEALNGETTDSRKMEVQIGGAVTLECDGGCWGHGPGMDPAGGPGTLALGRVVYQDAGEYRCVAPDKKLQDAWKAQLPYEIKVTGRPMLHPVSQSVTARDGEPLKIAVEFCAEPAYTKLLWLSSESVYLPGSETRNGVRALKVESGGAETCFRATLRIDAVKTSHSGEWLMIVRSPGGIADASIMINVTRASNFNRANTINTTNSILSLLIFCLTLIKFFHQCG